METEKDTLLEAISRKVVPEEGSSVKSSLGHPPFLTGIFK